VRERDELFREACRIALQEGGFITAWIGMADAVTGRLVPLASAGASADFMDRLKQRLAVLDEATYANTLSATAIRERRGAVRNDLLNDPRTLFKAEHAEMGSRSLARPSPDRR
jgi:hypothetical protein